MSGLKARTRQQLEQDRERLARIGQIIPLGDFRNEVEKYFKSLALGELSDALGDPEDFVKELITSLREERDDEDERAFANLLEKEVSERLDEGVPQIPPEVIDAEVHTARNEFIRTWVGLLNLAWRFRADGVEELKIDRDTLYPSRVDLAPDKLEDWDRRSNRAVSSLLNSVALSQDAHGRLTRLLSERVLTRLISARENDSAITESKAISLGEVTSRVSDVAGSAVAGAARSSAAPTLKSRMLSLAMPPFGRTTSSGPEVGLEQDPIELPDGLEIALKGDRLVLRERD